MTAIFRPGHDQAVARGLGQAAPFTSAQIHPVGIKISAVADVGGVNDLLVRCAEGAKAMNGLVVCGQATDAVRAVGIALCCGSIHGNEIELLALVAPDVARRDQMVDGRRAVDFPHLVSKKR